ncbi:MAG: protein kinase, partial [Pseudomonadota bacterium]|nr:protein kinase [Pseudomonadota bacterium]
MIDQVTTGAATTTEFRIGEEICQDGEALYIIDTVLGNGAFGEVYKASPVGGGAALALKSVKPSLPPEKKAKLQVQLAAESAICFAIGAHPHLVSVRRVVPSSKGLLIAMDLVEGTDLRAHAGTAYNGPLYQGGREAANKRVDSIVAQLYKGLAHLHMRAVLHMDLKPENLMVGAGDHLRICDYGLAGYCHKQEEDPWAPGVVHTEYRGGPPVLICAPFTGGTSTYMSEQLVEVRRELAAATTPEDHERVRAKMLVTAATTDMVAAALIVLELYAQTNQWPLVESAGIDGGAVREMARKFLAKPALEEVMAWSGEQLAVWLASHQRLAQLQPMALDGSLAIGALLDAGVAGAAPPGVKMTVGAKGFLRLTVRRELPTLVMPPPL